MDKLIVAFYQDEEMDWVAEMECGHTQHMRHNPPWQNRVWVTSKEGREARLGKKLRCKQCMEAHNRSRMKSETNISNL